MFCMSVIIDPAFNPVPSLDSTTAVSLTAEDLTAPVRAVFVPQEGEIGCDCNCLDRDSLAVAGFQGEKGQTLAVPGEKLRVLVGVGEGIETDAELRDAVAAYARAASKNDVLGVDLTGLLADSDWDAEVAVQVVIEGMILARYRYDALKTDSKTVHLSEIQIKLPQEALAVAEAGVERGLVLARTASIARDLGNTPPRHLTARKLAAVVSELAPQFGLEVEVFDMAQLQELGCGGLLGVNAGSTEEPRMIKLRYRPENAEGHLGLVGKGIMYDSGGISLKPSNASHASMKMDMMGAGAVFASMTALAELGCKTAVTGWMMCTDNMPSGSATKLGDVLSMRGGKTVEVKNTDAEGRLVLADGLALATEEEVRPDAIVDIATLTGAAMMALGTRTAAVLANNDDVAKQLTTAADVTDENLWRLPLDMRYRDQLKSNVADLKNIGGSYAGTITAALFLHEFVDGIPWGHLDIAGPMESETDNLWRSAGSTGFGARLLAEFATSFKVPVQDA